MKMTVFIKIKTENYKNIIQIFSLFFLFYMKMKMILSLIMKRLIYNCIKFLKIMILIKNFKGENV